MSARQQLVRKRFDHPFDFLRKTNRCKTVGQSRKASCPMNCTMPCVLPQDRTRRFLDDTLEHSLPASASSDPSHFGSSLFDFCISHLKCSFYLHGSACLVLVTLFRVSILATLLRVIACDSIRFFFSHNLPPLNPQGSLDSIISHIGLS